MGLALPWRAFGRRSARPAFDPPIGRYVKRTFFQRQRWLAYLLLIGFGLFIGFAFGIFGQFFIVRLSIVLIPFVAVVLWLLPDTERVPRRWVEVLTFAMMVAVFCWPDYIAIDLRALPWITVVRLVVFPLVACFLLCLAMSKSFRRELADTLSAAPILWKLLVAFFAICTATIFVSGDVANVTGRVVAAYLGWFVLVFAGVYTFRQPGRTRLLAYLLWGIALYQLPSVLFERHFHKLPWVGHIPGFLAVNDEVVQKIIAGAFRSYTNIYRVQSVFKTPLSLAEFLAYVSPFVVHIGMTTRSTWVRMAAALTIPVMIFMIINTDSRLGLIGLGIALLTYGLLWSIARWRRNPRDLIAAAVVFAYPAGFAAVVAASFAIGRIRVRVWGGGATVSSNDARWDMYRDGIPLVLRTPWGHGMGQGGIALNYRLPDGTLTIDTYYLALALDQGILGFLIYFGMFLLAIYLAGRAYLEIDDPEIAYLGPVAASLVAFIVIKSVFSQYDNHPLIFLELGVVIALLAKARDLRRAMPRVRAPLPVVPVRPRRLITAEAR